MDFQRRTFRIYIAGVSL